MDTTGGTNDERASEAEHDSDDANIVDLGIEGLSAGTFLGAGGSANVFAATKLATGEQVAVKLLRASATSAKERARFTSEHETLAALDEHDGIVPVIDAGITSKFEPYFLMPLMRGSLQDHLDEQGPLDWQSAATLIADVADTIDFAHSKKILHRDLKPANILLDDDGLTLVSDFGIAKLMDASVSKSSKALGTPSFMPPERFTTTETAESTDVYGLGATLAALITGDSPFLTGQNDTDAAVMLRVLSDTPPDVEPYGVPAPIADVITSAMAKDPSDRPASAGDFANALRNALYQTGEAELGTVTIAMTRREIEIPMAPVADARGVTIDVGAKDPSRKQRRGPLVALGVFVIVALIGFGLSSVIGGGGEVVSAAGEVFLERADSAGEDPFFDEFDDLVVADPNMVERVSAQTSEGGGFAEGQDGLSNQEILALAFKGGEPGLYGGTGNIGACDRASFIAFLEEQPEKGEAWASVQDIDATNLRPYIEELTPVVLLADTRVTNHGFRNGEANALQSVLQAGTAVLVDEQGVPRAKCGCGNPLLPPIAQAGATSLVGEAWEGFNPSALAVVEAEDTPIDDFVLKNTDNGETIERPAGSEGATDRLLSIDAPSPLQDLTNIEQQRPDEIAAEVAGAQETPDDPNENDGDGSDDVSDSAASASSVPTDDGGDATAAGGEAGSPEQAPTTEEPEEGAAPVSSVTTTAAPTTTRPPTTTAAPTTTERPTTTTSTSTTTTTTTTTTPPQPVNITQRGSVAANSVFPGFAASQAVDGSTATSWFSTGPGAGPGIFTWTARESSLISEIAVTGNANHSSPNFQQGFGFSSLQVEVLNAGAVVWSGSGSGFGATFAPGVEGNEVRLTFTGHESQECGGFSELRITALE